MPNIHPLWFLLIAALLLVFFGPKRLPELGAAIGKGIREFRHATDDLKNDVTQAARPAVPPEQPATKD